MSLDKRAIRTTVIKDTEVTLWKNYNKKNNNDTYSITLSKKGMVYITVATINIRDLSYMIAKYDSVIEWCNYMAGENIG